MSTTRFSMNDALAFGWETTKSNLGLWIGTLLVALLVCAAPEILPKGAIRELVSFLLSSLVWLGIVRMSLRFCDGERPTIGDLFSGFPLLPQYIVATIVVMVAVLVGLILLIVPGIIIALQLFFYEYHIVDEEAGPFEALRRSSAITRGAKWDLFLFLLVLTGINILGALALLIGLFVTVPLSAIAMAYAFRQLAASAEVPA